MAKNSEVLNINQSKLLLALGFTKNNFYLAGGTALALHISHRTSLDFDFYTQSEFNEFELVRELELAFGKISVTQSRNQTVLVYANNVELSFFYYPYKLIAELEDYKNIKLASMQDIFAMKLIALVQRGTMRDFIDCYYLLKNFSLTEGLDFVSQKYPAYNVAVVLKALIYFDDAKDNFFSRGIELFDKKATWEKIRAELIAKVSQYQLSG